jgi:hypothetical protein
VGAQRVHRRRIKVCLVAQREIGAAQRARVGAQLSRGRRRSDRRNRSSSINTRYR